ncbi:MAG: MBL fold metallo-hydrolase [Candidatus Marinimicrobia bacterium]|nr:MBL fold metallo-hydrolase [Candidatus Neomarinimicrobiota bacterium]
MPLRTLVTGPFRENTYLVWAEGANAALLIDPGDEPEIIQAAALELQVQVALILLTHGHLDHVGAVDAMREVSGAPAAASRDERELIAWFPESCRLFGLPERPAPTIDHWLKPDASHLPAVIADLLPWGPAITIHQTPGHTLGGVTYQVGGDLFTGDTLFKESIGRTDLPGGDMPTLAVSLAKLVRLGDDLNVYPGHGESTTIGQEKMNNGYIQQLVPAEFLGG